MGCTKIKITVGVDWARKRVAKGGGPLSRGVCKRHNRGSICSRMRAHNGVGDIYGEIYGGTVHSDSWVGDRRRLMGAVPRAENALALPINASPAITAMSVTTYFIVGPLLSAPR